ncbi:MAG: hypothetical protein ACTSQ8_22605 [Candidatus Helarchaeota archaeon]
MDDSGIFITHPRNGAGIIRSQTMTLRIWDVPRSQHSFSILQSEMNQEQYPALYILFEGDRKVYVGETESILNRLRSHHDNPHNNIPNWERALIINDGRTAGFSDFNDTAVRHSLEYYLKTLLRYNRFQVISFAREQQLTAFQTSLFNSIKNELNLFLLRYNLISRFIDRPEEREIFPDELREILVEHGFNIENWGQYEAIIDGEKYYIRHGSDKSKGWQVTLRGRKPGSPIDAVVQGDGYLLIRRGKIFIIPLEVIKELTDIENDSERDTIDVFLSLENDNVVLLKYHQDIPPVDVTEYQLLD